MTWRPYKSIDEPKVLCDFFRKFHPFHVDAPVMEGKRKQGLMNKILLFSADCWQLGAIALSPLRYDPTLPSETMIDQRIHYTPFSFLQNRWEWQTQSQKVLLYANAEFEEICLWSITTD
jgi:hypothetical protein